MKYTIERTTNATNEKDYFAGIFLDTLEWSDKDHAVTHSDDAALKFLKGLLLQSSSLSSVNTYMWKVVKL